MLKLGIDPTTSTHDDWKKAAATLQEQKDKGIVRQYYDQSYITALENGDTWISQAWSGDVFQAHAKGFTDLKFIVPKEGAMIWHDNMMIPKGAANPLSALAWMNYYYTPETAGLIEDYVNYICPVPAAQDYILKQLDDAGRRQQPARLPDPGDVRQGARLLRVQELRRLSGLDEHVQPDRPGMNAAARRGGRAGRRRPTCSACRAGSICSPSS